MTITLSKQLRNTRHYRWWAYVAIAIGLFVTVMDQSGVTIALPRIADHFSVDIPTVQWITLIYVLTISALLMPMGRLSDIIGRKRVYIIGLAIFMAAAALGGSAQNFPILLAAKALQGVGGAAIQANAMAMILEAFTERERGKAVGLHMAVIGTGAISGPIFGGLLVSELGWRSIFFASIVVGVIALVAATAILRGGASAGQADSGRPRFDWAGAFMSSAVLVSLLLGMTTGYRTGWTEPPIVAAFASAFIFLAAFLWWELRAADPMLDLRMFRSSVFSMGVSARFLSFLGGSAVFFLMPFYLTQALGHTASRAGLMMVAASICMAVAGPVSGRISDRVGTRWLAVLGLALSASAMFIFSGLAVDSSPVHVIIGMVLWGLGMGIFSSANTSAVMGSVPRDTYGITTAFLNVARTSANVTGIALATTIITITMGSLGYEPSLAAVSQDGGEGVRTAFVSGLNRALMTSGFLMVVAMMLSTLRGEAPAVSPVPTHAGAAQRRQHS